MVEVNKPSGDPAERRGRRAITVLTSAALLFFVLLAAAGLRGWTADSRDVEYRLWPLAPAPAAIPCQTPPSGWSVR